MSDFSAAPSTLGTLHQLRGGLLLLLENEERDLLLEHLDDLELRSRENEPHELRQLKLRAAGTQIGDYDADLWKTLRVWSTAVTTSSVDPAKTLFSLVTTAIARDDSAAAMLAASPNRNPDFAGKRLTQVAEKSSNKDLVPAFTAFKALTEPQRSALLSNAYVCDGAMDMTATRARIEQELRFSVEPGQRAPLADRLEGWWFNLCVGHLAGAVPRLSGRHLSEKVLDLARSFSPTSLPIDCGASNPAAGEREILRGRRFVHQLNVLEVQPSRVEHAVLDYYRAFTQRSRWAADQLLLDEHVTQYEDRLREEWDRMRATLEDASVSTPTDAEMRAMGLDLLRWMEQQADYRIRKDVEERYVARGSYHMLADRKPLRLWWHPDYPKRHAPGEGST